MMMMRKACFVFALFSMSACSNGATSQATDVQPTPQPVSTNPNDGATGTTTTHPTAPTTPTTPNAPASGTPLAPGASPTTFVGRFDLSNPNAARMALLQSKVGASFTGTSLSVELSDTGIDLFNVVIDGAAPIVITSKSATAVVIPITQSLSAGTHTVWMSKRTEFAQSNAAGTEAVGETTFYGFVLGQGGVFMTPPAPATRRIEFIGDSGFSSYGVEQIDVAHTSSNCYEPETQNGDESTPGYTGALLNADVINDSWSGEGVYLSVYDPTPSHALPINYPYTLPPNASPLWNFASWQADVVVISAGGDDLAGDNAAGYFPDPAAWQTSYVNLLSTIRTNYPHALIVNVLSQAAQGNDIVTLGGAIQQAIATRVTAGDTNVVYYNYFTGTPYTTYDDVASAQKLYWGCSGHPSALGAHWLGNQLATFIKSKKGW